MMVGGYAGSGKSELARFLGAVTGWPVLDKDVLTRPMVERMLIELGSDPDDRNSEAYATHVKPREYRCLMRTAWERLESGVSVIVDAPFVAQFADEEWMRRLSEKCGSRRVASVVVWVACDVDSMFEHVKVRGATRDSWKLQNWDTYAAGLNTEFRPIGPHVVVDNRHGAAIAQIDRAREALMRCGGW